MIEPTRFVTRQATLVPTKAVVFYEEARKRQYEPTQGAAYLSIHNIEWEGNQAVLDAGRPASRRALREVLRAVAPKLVPPPVVVPEHVLAHGGGYVFWWTPPAPRSMFFRNEFMGPDETSNEDHKEFEVVGRCMQPGLVWAWGTSGWKVWAVKGAARPTADTPLFNAPYFNVFADHAVCVGNMPVPKASSEDFDLLIGMVDAFFASWFTHPNYGNRPGGESLLKHASGVYRFWRDAVQQSLEQFPEDVLVSARMTLQEALNTYVTGQSRPRFGIAQELT